MDERYMMSALRAALRAYVRDNPRFRNSVNDEISCINNLDTAGGVAVYASNCGIDAGTLVDFLFRAI